MGSLAVRQWPDPEHFGRATLLERGLHCVWMVKGALEAGPPLVRTPTAAHARSLRGRRGLWHVARAALALVGAIACLDEGGLATAGSPLDARPYPSYIALQSGRSYSLPRGVGVQGSLLAVPVGIAR